MEFLLAVFVVGIYNGLSGRRNRVDEALAQIEVQLKRRHDLIPNLVNAVKGYMGFEQKVLTDVTQARAKSPNRRHSVILALAVVVLLGILGFAIGYALTGDPVGSVGTTIVALVVGILMSIGSYFAGG